MDIKPSERESTVKMLRREALAMRGLSHPNVVDLLGIVLDHKAWVALLMEHAEYGSLRDALDDHAGVLAGHPTARLRIALDVAHGMAYLHALEPPILQ